jgi:Cytochrome P460
MFKILAFSRFCGSQMQRIAGTVQPQVYRRIRRKKTIDCMFITAKLILLSLAVALVAILAETGAGTTSGEAPEYTADAQLKLPEHYREWVWLTSDFYTISDPAKLQAGPHLHFNNMFVNPQAYKAFLATGAWPDKTMLVVEQRDAADMGSKNPNLKGDVQDLQTGLAVHVKDEARFPGKWAFFGFQGGKTTATMIPVTAACYSCHAARGAEDTTFVQYYPTLLPTAKSHGTLDAATKQETQSPATPAK